MNRWIRFGALLLAVLPAYAATTAKEKAPRIDEKAVLAHVNGDAITVHDILGAFTSRHGGHAKFLGGTGEAREFLDVLIDDRLFLQEAYNIGLDQDPEVQQLVDEYGKQKAADAFVASEIDEKSNPTEDEIQAGWNLLNFRIHARQIAVDTKEEAEEIRRAILAGGADFEDFVRTCSEAQSRSHDGRLVVNWGQFGPEWEKVVFALEPGELSPVIETVNGYEVVIVDDRVDVQRPAIDKVKSQIETVLRQRKADERKRVITDELWKKYGVELQQIDTTPRVLAQTLTTAPETIIAKWNSGQVTVAEAFDDKVLKMYAAFSPKRAAYEVNNRIRTTINGPLSTMEAAERKFLERPDLATGVDEYRQSLMKKALFRNHVFKDVAVTDDDVKKFYDGHKAQFTDQEQRHVAHIMVPTAKDALEARQKVTSGDDFEDVVKKMSRDFMTASSAGDLGWITEDKVPPSFREVWTLGSGALSKPIQSPKGWHIIKVLEIKPQRQMTLDEVKDKVRTRALDDKQRAARAFWLHKLRSSAKIDVNDAAIKAFAAANEFTAAAPPQHSLQ